MFPESLVFPLRFVSILLAVFLVVAIGRGAVEMANSVIQLDNRQPESTVVISGTGEVDVVPSSASVTISVIEKAAAVTEVTAQGNATMKKVQDALIAVGIPKEDIQTNAYQLYPEYDYEKSGTERITGYSLSQSVDVTIDDIDMVGAVLDAGLAAGANSVGTPVFEVEDEEALKEEARKEALSNIEIQKESYEQALGVDFEDIVSITESSGGGYPYPVYLERSAAEASDTAGSSAPISAGTNTLTVELHITFAID